MIHKNRFLEAIHLMSITAMKVARKANIFQEVYN